MGKFYLAERSNGPWRILLALLCVLLVAAAGTAQVAHAHNDGTDTHADCSLCATAHLSVQLVHTPAPAPTVRVVAVLEARPPAVVSSVFCTFALFTRPPPAV